MPTYQITGPDGKKYKVTGDNPQGALEALRKHSKAPASPAAMDAPEKPAWSAAAEADQIEKLRQPGAFSDATDSVVMSGIPFADEIMGGMQAPFRAVKDWAGGEGFDVGRSYDRSVELERELQRRREDRSPVASTAGAVAGGMAVSAPLAKAGVSFLNGARPTLASMAGRGAAEGAAYGAAYGLGEGENVDQRLYNAAQSAAIGGTIGGATGALARMGTSPIDEAALPTVDDLRQAASAAYQKADDAGVVYSKDAMKRIADALSKDYADFGYHPALQPKAGVVLDEVNRLAGDNVTLKGIDVARKMAGKAYDPTNKASNALNTKVVEALDNLVQSPQAGDVVIGSGEAGATALNQARKLYQQSAKLDTVESVMRKAGLDAASSGSGGNIENATRRELKKILTNPKLQRGFTDVERKALEQAVLGTKTQNALRLLGKVSPEGNGLSMMLHLLGGTATGGATVPLAAAGMMAKRGADAMSQQSANVLRALIASGGEALPQKAISPAIRALIEASGRGASQIGLGAGTSPAPRMP